MNDDATPQEATFCELNDGDEVDDTSRPIKCKM